MLKLFYSTSEKIVFYITGYVDTYFVNDMIKVLEDGKETLTKGCEGISIDQKEIKSYEILTSSRYKSMRVFYVDAEQAPKEAFAIGKDWTMDKWIKS